MGIEFFTINVREYCGLKYNKFIQSMIYCYPKLSKWDMLTFRFGGPGLGNLLFPWARAKVLSIKYNYAFISPTWPQIKIGPIIRRELDSRSYYSLFKSSPSDIRGLHRIKILIANRAIDEKNHSYGILKAGDVVIVSGMEGMFSEILEYSEYLANELSGILKRNSISELENDYQCNNSIAIHVRFGDFSTFDQKSVIEGCVNSRLPIEWYISAINAVRSSLGGNIRVNLFSDAKDDELAPLLALTSVTRVCKNNAIEDMLLMSKHKVLIASSSTFSMWASFLGQIPTVWFPCKNRAILVRKEHYEIEFNIGDNLDSWVEKL